MYLLPCSIYCTERDHSRERTARGHVLPLNSCIGADQQAATNVRTDVRCDSRRSISKEVMYG
jgi:hypothetical protein